MMIPIPQAGVLEGVPRARAGARGPGDRGRGDLGPPGSAARPAARGVALSGLPLLAAARNRRPSAEVGAARGAPAARRIVRRTRRSGGTSTGRSRDSARRRGPSCRGSRRSSGRDRGSPSRCPASASRRRRRSPGSRRPGADRRCFCLTSISSTNPPCWPTAGIDLPVEEVADRPLEVALGGQILEVRPPRRSACRPAGACGSRCRCRGPASRRRGPPRPSRCCRRRGRTRSPGGSAAPRPGASAAVSGEPAKCAESPGRSGRSTMKAQRSPAVRGFAGDLDLVHAGSSIAPSD